MSADVDIVIVGGGAAGVGAARRLADSGLSTLVLEAGSRLGGRACTQEFRGLDLDLGCGWLHSAERNSWAAIAQATGTPLDINASTRFASVPRFSRMMSGPKIAPGIFAAA